jgi:hypothetical protein
MTSEELGYLDDEITAEDLELIGQTDEPEGDI